MARLSDKIKVFRDMEYVNKEGEKQNIGMKDLYRASTSDARYPLDRNILFSAVSGEKGRGKFIPDSFTTNELVGLVKDRKFKFDIVKGLKAIEKEYLGKPLRQEQQ